MEAQKLRPMIRLESEETQATNENIIKYYNTLKKLHNILQLTGRISMLKFSEQNKVTKSLSTVLQKGGVIKLTGKGRASNWEWITIDPTREMAIRVLKELASINPPREYKKRGGKREGAGRKTKKLENTYLESMTVKYFFGLLTARVKLNYKTIK